jgi:2',3'-cyclic-nucleotide 2'-phosphodiesterase
LKILFIGDIVGNSGRKMAKNVIKAYKEKGLIDCIIANAENAAGGKGITHAVANELFESGIDIITMGNHTFAKKEIKTFIDDEFRIIRPANYPSGVPGKGSVIFESEYGNIGIINLMGRIYMESIDCPFKAADREIEYLKSFTRMIIIDMHAEATSEKCALAWYVDGRASCVIGTHTHVQTSDERILPKGTGFITDAGMTGPYESIIGVNKDIIVNKFITHLPARFEIAKGAAQFNGIIVDIDEKSGKTIAIERIFKKTDE